jgi:hypothetical protein
MTWVNRAVAGVGRAAFFGAAPGVVAGVVPWLLTDWVVPPASTTSLIVRGTLAAVAILSALVVLIGAFVRWYEEPVLVTRYGVQYDDVATSEHGGQD